MKTFRVRIVLETEIDFVTGEATIEDAIDNAWGYLSDDARFEVQNEFVVMEEAATIVAEDKD